MNVEYEFHADVVGPGEGWPKEKDVLSWRMPDTRPITVKVLIKGLVKWCDFVLLGDSWVYFDTSGGKITEGQN